MNIVPPNHKRATANPHLKKRTSVTRVSRKGVENQTIMLKTPFFVKGDPFSSW
jgi:hypothetical protein